ncbi:hypothetical protein PPYR_04204 [Photinus pyralis]|uniref:Uncharacterized protein n=1 Tax=Photinus pyralis TaxID=7054 RepID=A0A5N4AXP5_PHOPY|nr:hypothetical protein PPYR_04204 [Photinus pyralis]
MMLFPYFLAIIITIIKVQDATSASYSNCRLMKGDVLLYHRRIKEDVTKHYSLHFASFPEILLDKRSFRNIPVISCIMCKDQSLKKALEPESECKVIGGGIGHTFVKFVLTSSRYHGFDYDIKIYGQKKLII